MPISTSPAPSTGTALPCPVCGAPAEVASSYDEGVRGPFYARCHSCDSAWVPLDEWNSDALVVVPPSEGPSARSLFEQSKARLAVIAKEGNPIWGELRREVEAIAPDAQAIVITRVDQTDAMRMARGYRLKLREIRLAAEKQHKALKRDIIDRGNAIDDAKNEIVDVVKPLEQHLLEQEEFEKRQIAAETEARQREREEILRGFVDAPETLPLAAMSEEEFLALRDFHEARFYARQDAERKAAAEEAARVKKDADEREAQRLENIRLSREAAERERALITERAEAAKELQKQAAKAAEAEKARQAAEAEHERTLAAEREAARRASRAAEAADIAKRDALEAQHVAEGELRRQKDEARRQQEAEQAARARAAKAPDREKLLALAASFDDMEVPIMSTEAGCDARGALMLKLDQLAAWVRSRAESL